MSAPNAATIASDGRIGAEYRPSASSSANVMFRYNTGSMNGHTAMPRSRARRQPTIASDHMPTAHTRMSREFLRLVSWYQKVRSPTAGLPDDRARFLHEHPFGLVVEDLVVSGASSRSQTVPASRLSRSKYTLLSFSGVCVGRFLERCELEPAEDRASQERVARSRGHQYEMIARDVVPDGPRHDRQPERQHDDAERPPWHDRRSASSPPCTDDQGDRDNEHDRVQQGDRLGQRRQTGGHTERHRMQHARPLPEPIAHQIINVKRKVNNVSRWRLGRTGSTTGGTRNRHPPGAPFGH